MVAPAFLEAAAAVGLSDFISVVAFVASSHPASAVLFFFSLVKASSAKLPNDTPLLICLLVLSRLLFVLFVGFFLVSSLVLFFFLAVLFLGIGVGFKNSFGVYSCS